MGSKPVIYLIPTPVFLITALSYILFKRFLFKYDPHKMGHLFNKLLSKHFNFFSVSLGQKKTKNPTQPKTSRFWVSLKTVRLIENLKE